MAEKGMAENGASGPNPHVTVGSVTGFALLPEGAFVVSIAGEGRLVRVEP